MPGAAIVPARMVAIVPRNAARRDVVWSWIAVLMVSASLVRSGTARCLSHFVVPLYRVADPAQSICFLSDAFCGMKANRNRMYIICISYVKQWIAERYRDSD